jgi:hypothetical protein
LGVLQTGYFSNVLALTSKLHQKFCQLFHGLKGAVPNYEVRRCELRNHLNQWFATILRDLKNKG